MIRTAALSFALIISSALFAQGGAPKQAVPPSMVSMVLPSHGNNLLGVFYLAAGAGSHPTVVLFHGFPGFEQNLDLAQTLRQMGWNVLALHYRGSWGVGGHFSFKHAVEDADTEVRFVLDPINARKYRIDTSSVIVVGHSMGGYMAASAAAHNTSVKAAALLSPWNIGAQHGSSTDRWTETEEAKSLASDNDLAPLAGTSASTLAHEEFTHRSELDLNRLAAAIAPRPVLIISAEDSVKPDAAAFATALKTAGDARVSTQHFDSDHSYSGQRQQLTQSVLDFAQTIEGKL